jgi:hypothetical protein
MSLTQLRNVRAVIAATLTLIVLAGCATSGSPSQAQQWIMENEAQKKQLNDAGFPQYVGAN